MDALEFLKERSRMCLLHKACGGCPLEGAKCSLSSGTSAEEFERIVAIVEKWSKEHPRKTRQSVFLEQWPEARVTNSGILGICPANVSAKHRDQSACSARPCDVCCHEFWMQVVE